MAEDENVDEPAEDGEDAEDGQDGERIELTPEQQEALRQAAENLRRALTPKVKLPTITLPESTHRNIAAISRIAEAQQAMVSSAIKPILDAQAMWQRSFALSGGVGERVE